MAARSALLSSVKLFGLAAVTTAVEVLLEEVEPGHVQEQLHAILGEVRRMGLGFEGMGSVHRQLRSPRFAAVDYAVRAAYRVLVPRAERGRAPRPM